MESQNTFVFTSVDGRSIEVDPNRIAEITASSDSDLTKIIVQDPTETKARNNVYFVRKPHEQVLQEFLKS